jgi:type IV pilus assembly protein PilA
MKHWLKSVHGFSLIELMTVVAIIGIITTVATANYITYVQRSKITEVMRYAKSMQNSYAEYYIQAGSAPANLAALGLVSLSSSANYISSTAYNAGAGTLQVNVNVGALDSALGTAGCTLYYTFLPTVVGDILTWGCTINTNSINAACVSLVNKVSPAACS